MAEGAPSLWVETAPAGPACPALTAEIRAGVAIIGGGYTGLSAALHLAEAGEDAVVLEARTLGFGASGRNGGQVIAGLKDDPDTLEQRFGPDLGPRLVAAVGAAPDYLFALAVRLGVACDARPTGWIQAAHSEAARAAHAERARQWQARGVAAQALGAAGARAMIGSEAYVGGWHDPRGGTIQPLAWVRGLGAAALARGVRVFERTPATRLSREGEGWRIDTPGGSVRAARVIIATNGYADGLLPAWRRSLVPVHSLQVATEPLPAALAARILPGRQPVSDSYNLLRYYQIDPAGRLVLGCRGPFRDRVSAQDGAEARAHVRAIFPELAGVAFGHVWAGTVAITPDHLPHLHEAAPGLFAAGGYNGRGVALSTTMGRFLALLAGGAPPEAIDFPMTPLRPIRLHGLSRLGARVMTALYRRRDRRG